MVRQIYCKPKVSIFIECKPHLLKNTIKPWIIIISMKGGQPKEKFKSFMIIVNDYLKPSVLEMRYAAGKARHSAPFFDCARYLKTLALVISNW